jgi:hypothetical protein
VAGGIASPGDALLWRYAAAGAAGPGSYVISVSNAANASLYSDAESVEPPAAATGSSAFTFPFTVPAAGNYTATVTDLAAPAGLAAIEFAVFQNGAAVPASQSGTAGTVTFAAAAGTAQLVVVAQAQPNSAGLFGAQVQTTGASPSSVLATAQAVGTFTGSQTIAVTQATAGQYAVTLTDGGWPARFATLDVFVTSGATLVGEVYGSGTLSVPLAAGNYVLTYNATPDPTAQAGLYGVNVQLAAPTVSLSAAQSTIPSGQNASLTWTSAGATSCTGSGGWSGNEPTSGSGVAEGPLSVTTTFTLTCQGPGGTTAPASVTVTVTPSSASGRGGGGGAVGPVELALLGVLVAVACGRTTVTRRVRAR